MVSSQYIIGGAVFDQKVLMVIGRKKFCKSDAIKLIGQLGCGGMERNTRFGLIKRDRLGDVLSIQRKGWGNGEEKGMYDRKGK